LHLRPVGFTFRSERLQRPRGNAAMTGSQESEEFDADDEGDESVDDDGLDVDRVIKDMEIAKRRTAKGGEPAWRRLERRMEQQHTAELISDFEDYDIGDGQGPHMPRKSKADR
jgi:hypothetical protein